MSEHCTVVAVAVCEQHRYAHKLPYWAQPHLEIFSKFYKCPLTFQQSKVPLYHCPYRAHLLVEHLFEGRLYHATETRGDIRADRVGGVAKMAFPWKTSR